MRCAPGVLFVLGLVACAARRAEPPNAGPQLEPLPEADPIGSPVPDGGASGTEADAGRSDAEQRAAEVRFEDRYPPDQRVVLADWVARHGVRRRPEEEDCWELRGVTGEFPTGLLCVRTRGKNLRTERVATAYMMHGPKLQRVWSEMIGAWQNWLELTPIFAGSMIQLVERREGDCVRALRQAKDKAAAGAHPHAFVELLYSACLRMGRYLWVEGRYVFAGPSLEVTGARFPCADPPPSADESSRDDGEREDVDVLRLREALGAFDRRDEVAIRRWIARVETRPEERVFGAFLLHRLGVVEGREMFVAQFPERNRRGFQRLLDLAEALEGETVCLRGRRPECFDPQFALGCAAIAGWEGAARKLLLVHGFTDAGSTSDNHELIAETAAARPDEVLSLAVRLCAQGLVVHSFGSEAQEATAKRALGKLTRRRYPDKAVEELRRTLLPVLRRKAARPSRDEPLNCAEHL